RPRNCDHDERGLRPARNARHDDACAGVLRAAAGLTELYGIATGSYVEDRDDWPRAVDRARRERWRFLELTAVFESLLSTLVACLAADDELVEGFERVSLHAPIHAPSPAGLVEVIADLQFDDVIFHP